MTAIRTWIVELRRGGQMERTVGVMHLGQRLEVEDYQRRQTDLYHYVTIDHGAGKAVARYADTREWD